MRTTDPVCGIHNVRYASKRKLGIYSGAYIDVKVCISCVRAARGKVKDLICRAVEARHERQRHRG